MRIVNTFDRQAEGLSQKVKEEKDWNSYDSNQTEDKCADHSASDLTLNQIYFFFIFDNLFASGLISIKLCHFKK